MDLPQTRLESKKAKQEQPQQQHSSSRAAHFGY